MGRTMKSYTKIEVSEKRLEDMIRQAPHLIEDGLRYVDHQRKTERGPLDMLLVDSAGALVVAELKVCEDDTMLVQGIDYYDWISRNVEGLSRAYKDMGIRPRQTPRLLLVAPTVSVTLLNRCKWIDIPISVFTFTCLKFEDSGDIPVFSEVTIPSAPDIIETYTVEDKLNSITDGRLRTLAAEILEEIRSWDTSKILIEAIKYEISIKYNGRVIVYLCPRRKFFHIYTFDRESVWTGYKIFERADFENMQDLIKTYLEKVK